MLCLPDKNTGINLNRKNPTDLHHLCCKTINKLKSSTWGA